MTERPDLYLASDLPPATVTALEQRFCVHRSDPPAATRAIAGGGAIDAALMERLPALEIIALHSVGYDTVDVAEAERRGIRVTNTPDVLTDDVADLAIGLWLAVERRIAVNDRVVRDGGWGVPLARKASGRRIGIFGLGRIGEAIARRAEPFGGEILYTAHSAKEVTWRFLPDIVALAAACDVLILAAPGGAETSGVVDANVLAKLGERGVLINVARGSLVDQTALVAALAAGTIAGAGLDVFADEPDVPAELRSLDQVVLSPHQGSATVETRAAMSALMLANLDAHFAGEALPSAVV